MSEISEIMLEDIPENPSGDTPITHPREIFQGFDLTRIEDLRQLREALDRMFVQNKRNVDLTDLKITEVQDESLDFLWSSISNKDQDTELAKQYLRMIIAAPALVREKHLHLSERDLGLAIIGAALHGLDFTETSSDAKSAEALETSFDTGMEPGMGGPNDQIRPLVGHKIKNDANKLKYRFKEGELELPPYSKTLAMLPRRNSTRLASYDTIDKPRASKDKGMQNMLAGHSSTSRSATNSTASDDSGSEYEEDTKLKAKQRKVPLKKGKTAAKKKRALQNKKESTYRSLEAAQNTSLRPGDRPVDKNIDRKEAKRGIWDMEKLKFEYSTICDDPEIPGYEIAGRPVSILYPLANEVNFDDAKSIKSINNWRLSKIQTFESALHKCQAGGRIEEVGMDDNDDSELTNLEETEDEEEVRNEENEETEESPVKRGPRWTR